MQQGILNLRPGIDTFEIKTADTKVLAEELAYDADALLGYAGMRKSLGVAGPLGRVLVELGIKPYKPEDVDIYKERVRDLRIEELYAADGSRGYKSDYWNRVKWEMHPLPGYQNYVEPFALDIARSIKRKLPEVEFFVDVMVERYGNAGDPFLIAQRGEEKFFVAVWDEPIFEAQQEE